MSLLHRLRCWLGPLPTPKPSRTVLHLERLEGREVPALTPFRSMEVHGDYVAAGMGCYGYSGGTIQIAGIPAGATVEAAYLYFLVSRRRGDENYHVSAVRLAKGSTNASFDVAPLGFNWGDFGDGDDSDMLPDEPRYSGRADVTSYVRGNGDYTVTLPVFQDFILSRLHGASLVVVYDKPSLPSRTVRIYDGHDVGDATPVSNTLGGFEVKDPAGARTTFVATTQAYFWNQNTSQNSYTVTGGNGTLHVASGIDSSDPFPPYNRGLSWDTDTYSIAQQLAANDTSVTLTAQVHADIKNDDGSVYGPIYFEWLAQALSLAATDEPDIAITDATTQVMSMRSVKVKYAVSNKDADKDFFIKVYLSEDAKYDAGDEPIAAKKVLKSAAKAGLKGAAKEYDNFHIAITPGTLTREKHFLIVVADPAKEVEVDAEGRRNNEAFVIPLFPAGVFGGYDLTTGLFQPLLGEAATSLGIRGRIARGTADFDRLLDVTTLWNSVGGQFKDEDPAPYVGDDHRVDPGLIDPLTRFVELIKLAKDAKRPDMPAEYVITEAFDSQGEHDTRKPLDERASRHFDGRSLDIRASGKALERMSGLAMLAGFAWAFNEHNHLHVSHLGAQAEVSASAISQALQWGLAYGLVRNQATYDALNGLITTNTLTSVRQFLQRVALERARGRLRPEFAALMTFNANSLLRTF